MAFTWRLLRYYGVMQADPPPPPAPGPIDVHIDLSGLANLIWQSFIDHIGDVGNAAWTGIVEHLPQIGTSIWTPLSSTLETALHGAAVSVWAATFGQVANIYGQLPPEWTTDSPVYRAIATDPLPIAVGGATLALALLGLRTLLGAMVGGDSVITHISGRLIPAVFLCLAYPVLVVRAVQLLNAAAGAVGTQAALATLVEFPQVAGTGADLPILALWVLLIWYGLKLLLRLIYSIFRFTVALVFGPVAIILWAIPQTEWLTWFWLRELVGWGTTPLLVSVCLAIAVPLALGRSGFLAAAAFGIAGFMAAHDLVGLLSLANNGRGVASPLAYVRMAAGAAGGGGVSAGAQAAAMRSFAASERAAATERYFGYD
jgi:hypothetical protein